MRPGDPLTYTVAIFNEGVAPVTGVVVSDTFPVVTHFITDSIVITPAEAAGLPGDAGTQPVLASNITVAASSTVTVTYAVTVDSAVANGAEIVNTAWVTSSENSSPVLSTVVTTVTHEADLAIGKSGSPAPVIAGSAITYTLVVTNHGPSNATGVVVTDTLPISVSFVSATPAAANCSHSGGKVTCNLGTLASDGTRSVTIRGNVASGTLGMLTNRATVGSATTDPNTGNNTGSVDTGVQTQADLSVTKTASPSPVTAGTELIYTVVIRNHGPSNSANVRLTDFLPTGVILNSVTPQPAASCTSGATIICNWSSISSGSSVTATIRVAVPSSLTTGSLDNDAIVASLATYDPDPNNDTVTIQTPLQTLADLAIGKRGSPDPVTAGQPITYTLVVTNHGPSNAAGVVMTDTLPSEVSFVSATPGGNCSASGRVVTCNLGTLAGNGTRSVTIRGNVAAGAAGSLSNLASVGSVTTDPNTGNNTSSTNTGVQTRADLAISKRGSPAQVTAGEAITYTLVVTNHGPSNATGVVVTDSLPPGVSFVSATPGGNCSESGRVVTCNLGTLTRNSSVSVQILATVFASTTGVLVNEATVAGLVADDAPGNNTASVITAVNTKADLAISKRDSPDPVLIGDPLTYTLTITNNGPSDAAGVTVTDILPPSVSFRSASDGCSFSGSTVTCNLGSLAKNGVKNVSIVVTPSVVGPLTNFASVSSATADPNGANNISTANSTVHPKADLQIQKSDAPDPVIAGENLTYTLTIINKGPSTATGVTVVDGLPAGVSFTSVASSRGTCGQSGGQITCSLGNLLKDQSATITIRVAVNLSTTGTLVNTATVAGSEADPNLANNTAFQSTTVQKPGPRLVYLPLALKPGLTLLSVHNDNTGGTVQFTVIGAGVSCSVLNNEVKFCGSFPAGAYSVQVVTSTCGSNTFARVYGSGPETTRVFCNR